MWNPPRQLLPGFRGHPGEPFPPRIPPGSHPRMRGRPPFPFREGPRVSNPHFGGPGVAPFMHRNMDVSMDGRWEEGRMLPEEQLHLSRRPRPNMNYRPFREGEGMDMHYGDMGGPEKELRARLAPDMDYREREASILNQRGMPDVDYRHEEGAAIAYRERLPPPPAFRDRDSLEYRRRLQAVEPHRQRTPLDYPDREMEELEYKRRLDALQEIVLRQRESAELLCREATDVRDHELRERSALGYNERAIPAHFRESADRDLRFREPDVDVNFLDQERALDYRERIVIDYSHSETATYGETEGADYVEYKASQKSQSSVIPKGVAGIARRDLKSAGAAEPPYKKRDIEIPGINTDADYREKESADSDYRGKETSDSDYRDNTDSDYRDMEAADSDYRDKESADSDYRERERADADYRKRADNGVKKSANTMEAKDGASKPGKNPKELKAAITAPDLAPKPLSSTEQRVPFLSYDKPQASPVTKINNEAPLQEGALSAPKGGAKSDKCSFPGKLDVDFRDRPKAELTQETKEAGNKTTRYSAGGKELGPSDQDLRGKEPAQGGGDQDFRTSKYVQKKDEDLRAGKEQASAGPLGQSSLLYDFLTLAAKELKQQQEKEAAGNETEGPVAVHTPEKPAAARPSHPTSNKSPGVEFLGRQDADYRSKDYMDVDLRVACGTDKKSQDGHQPGSKDKDYRRTTIPDGATRTVWLDGLPTGASREDILSALGAARPLPKEGVSLIGYIPGYSFGSVCVEFSLVEEAVGCMEANKGVLSFRGKKISLKYIPNSDRWSCQQCKVVNVLSKERCWQCSALRAGSDHLPVREALKEAKTPTLLTSRRAKKRKAKPSPPPPRSTTSQRKRSPPPKADKGGKPAKAESATVIIRGIGVTTTPDSVVKALKPYVQLSVRNIRIMKNRKSDHRGFGFIDLRNHKEAIRLTVLVRELKPPLTIDGKPISVDLAVGERRNEHRKSQKGNKASAKNRNRRAQRRSITYPGFKDTADGPSYVYDPKTGMYMDPLTNTYYSENRSQRKKDDHQSPGGGKKEPSRQPRRGFTEDEVKDSDEEPFKRPLPPLVTKKEEPPLEPKHNPLIKLLGEYGDDSEEEEEELLPPVKKKPAPPPPAPPPKPAPPTSSPAAVHEEKLTDWKKMICLLCRRQFPSKDALIRHQKLSDLHKQNLAIQEKIRKSQKELAYLKEQEENQSIQRRLLQARKELEMLERQEEGAQQEREGLDSEVQAPGNKKPKGSDPGSEPKPKVKKQAGASYRDNMKRRILERYKELE